MIFYVLGRIQELLDSAVRCSTKRQLREIYLDTSVNIQNWFDGDENGSLVSEFNPNEYFDLASLNPLVALLT